MWKVLIADDEAFVREGLKSLIPWEELGYQYGGGYKNGQELLDAVPVEKPDLVILDIQMPILSGLEAARLISEQWPWVAVVLLTAYGEFQYAKQAIEYHVRSYVMKNNVLEELPKILKDISAQMEEERKKGNGAVVERLTEAIGRGDLSKLSEILEMGAPAAEDQAEQGLEEDLIRRVKAFVEENYSRKLTLDNIAEAVYITPSYLSRLYKQKTGENLFDAVNKRRMEEAARYIAGGSKRIGEIAALVGIEDTAYFSRVFKKYTGYSPKEYERLKRREPKEV